MKRLILIFVLFTLFAPLPLEAQQFCDGVRCAYIPLEPLPGQQVDAQRGVDFASYLNYAFTLFIVIGGMFAVATFVWGGIMYMVSDVVGKKDFAKKQMQRSIWGIVLLLGSYILLYTINPRLVQLDAFNPNSVNQQQNLNNAFQATQRTVLTQQERDAANVTCQRQGMRAVIGTNGSVSCAP